MADTQWTGFLPKQAVLMKRRSRALPPIPLDVAIPDQDSHERIAQELEGCPRCKLCQGRTRIVQGEGPAQARLMFVGEAPGEQEDLSGRPFVGRAGQLLEKMIIAMGLSREQVFIANIVKCRPPDNRNPEADEITACSPYLLRQIALVQPDVIVTLGKFASQTLLATEVPISQLRGQFHPFQGGKAKLMPTFHPAYLLRNPPSKKEAWEDLKAVARELGLTIPLATPPARS